MQQLGALAIPRQPAFQAGHGALHAAGAQLRGKDGGTKRPKQSGIEIGYGKPVKPARQEGQRQEAGYLEHEATARKWSHGPGKSYRKKPG
jgi:hypothetical protein